MRLDRLGGDSDRYRELVRSVCNIHVTEYSHFVVV